MIRTVMFREHPIQVEAKLHYTTEVDIGFGVPIRYMLGVWNPKNHIARQAFQKIRTSPLHHQVFFAADYDVANSFHVNNWPEEEQGRTIAR